MIEESSHSLSLGCVSRTLINHLKYMKLRIATLSLALLAGSMARANFIQLAGVITGGSGTNIGGFFSGNIFGPDFFVSGRGSSHFRYQTCTVFCNAPGSYSMFDGAAYPLSEEHFQDSAEASFTDFAAPPTPESTFFIPSIYRIPVRAHRAIWS